MQKIYTGETVAVHVAFIDDNGNPINLNDYEIKTFSEKVASGLSLCVPHTANPLQGVIVVNYTSDMTEVLGAGVIVTQITLTRLSDGATMIDRCIMFELEKAKGSKPKACESQKPTVYEIRLCALDINMTAIIGTIIVNDGGGEIPTKTSQLINDSGFITIANVPTKTSELDNDSNFITSSDIPAIPTKTSELNNDSGFITLAQVPPEENFIDLWKSSASIYGGYDPATKLFNLNGLTDITYKQAIDIYQRTANIVGTSIDYRVTWSATGIRTNLPPKYFQNEVVTFTSYLSDMEVINLRPQNPFSHTMVTLSSAFTANSLYNNLKLKTIQGVLRLVNYTNSQPNLSYGLPMLENVQFTELKTSFAILAQAPRISLDSFTFLVNNATNGATAITVRVHADVYAKMIDSTNYPAWASLLALAVSKNISFAV